MRGVVAQQAAMQYRRRTDTRQRRDMRTRRHWTGSFGNCMKNYSRAMTAADAEIAAKCTREVFRRKRWIVTQSVWA